MNKESVEILDPRDAAAGDRRLLGFYDHVRARVEGYLERRAGKTGARVAAALLLVPDVLLLLVRLFLDREVPRSSRALIGGALAYFLLPADLAPEIVIGPVGYLDDLIIACTVLAHALGPDLEVWAERYWSGSRGLREVLTEITQVGNSLLGVKMSKRIDRVLERRLLKQGQG